MEKTLNGLLDGEVRQINRAAGYERTEKQQAYRGGPYRWNLAATGGEVTLKMPEPGVACFHRNVFRLYPVAG
jgi:hypothetical protein